MDIPEVIFPGAQSQSQLQRRFEPDQEKKPGEAPPRPKVITDCCNLRVLLLAPGPQHLCQEASQETAGTGSLPGQGGPCRQGGLEADHR